MHPLEKRERAEEDEEEWSGVGLLEVCESDVNANVLLDAWPSYLFNSWQSTVSNARSRTILGVYHYLTHFGVRWEFHINWAGWAYIQLGHARSRIEVAAHIVCFLLLFFSFNLPKKGCLYFFKGWTVGRDFSCGRLAQWNSRPTL